MSRSVPRAAALAILAATGAVAAITAVGGTAAEDGPRAAVAGSLSPGWTFAERSGEALYANVCQGCHMPAAGGASGAGRYPSLAGDEALAAPGYVVQVVLHGLRGMPPFGWGLDDDQVAAVVTYARTHFGNRYGDAVTADDVRAARR